MRQSALSRHAQTAIIPASVGGWNARDALQAMKQTDAVALDNLIPGPGGVSMRGGSVVYARGLGTYVSALMRYTPPAAVPRLFAAAGPNVYDVTASGAVGTAALSGQTGSAWKGVMLSTPGGSYLMAFNGADAPQHYDGATWVAIKWKTQTGYSYTLDPTKLMAPIIFASRLWAIERGSLRVWYKPLNQIDTDPASGDTNFADFDLCMDLGAQCRLGGALVQMAVWTRDGGQGSDDYLVLLTTAGEVVIYGGTDPNSAATWSRVGVFRFAPPVGDKPMLQAGADVAVLTETGLIPLSSELPLDTAQQEQAAITDKIRGAFQSAYQSGAALPGWAVQEYPMGGLVLVNVPKPDGTFAQFVQNLLTSAWCSFSGLPATCWALLGDHLMFGTADGRVCQYDVGYADVLFPASAPVAQPVSFKNLPAFSAFKTLGRKRFTMARPLYNSALGYRAPIALKVDYDISTTPLPQPPIMSGQTPWGAPWGSPWGPIIAPVEKWTGLRGIGLVASVLVSGASLNPFRLDQIDIQFETGDSFP